MNSWQQFSILAASFCLIGLLINNFTQKTAIDLFVVILSKRSNFQLRNVIRQTWLNSKSNDYPNLKIKPFFVVGNQDCELPDQLLRDSYSCELWTFNNSEDLGLKVNSCIKHCQNHYPVQVYRGFSFKVHSDVELIEIALPLHILHLNGFLLIRDVSNQVLIGNFSLDQTIKAYQDSAYLPIEPSIVLPKNLIASVYLQTPEIENSLENCCNYKWNSKSFLLEILRVYSQINDFSSKVHEVEDILAINLVFRPTNYTLLKKNMDAVPNLMQARKNEVAKISSNLVTESNQFNDIMLVEVKEVYRNLARKLLLAIKSLVDNYQFKYFLKVDDDCYLWLDKIATQINTLPHKKKLWLGKTNMLIDLHGKWAEYEYPSSVYPKFACGSGYLITYYLANWIAKNYQVLHPFQGEDVSMGIWLASLYPDYFQSNLWSCSDQADTSDVINRCQLSAKEIIHLHRKK